MSDRPGTSNSILGKSPRPGRLTSLFPSKDLTLGSAQPKRQFTPNLALAGKRVNVPSEPKNSNRRDEPKKPYDRPNNNRGGRGRGRGGGRGGEMIQAKGIFSEGVAVEPLSKGKSDAEYFGGLGMGGGGRFGGGQGNRKQKEEIRGTLSSLKNEDPMDTDEQALSHLKADAFIDDNDDPEIPFVRLPLLANRDELNNKGTAGGESSTAAPLKFKVKLEQLVKSEAAVETLESASETYRSDSPELMLMQLPSVLGDLYNDAAAKETAKESRENDLEVEKPHCLASFPGGVIGKLQLLQSGKVRMIVDNHKFYFDVGTPTNFLQEVVSVDLREGEGDLSVLGRVKHRLKVLSDVKTLLSGVHRTTNDADNR